MEPTAGIGCLGSPGSRSHSAWARGSSGLSDVCSMACGAARRGGRSQRPQRDRFKGERLIHRGAAFFYVKTRSARKSAPRPRAPRAQCTCHRVCQQQRRACARRRAGGREGGAGPASHVTLGFSPSKFTCTLVYLVQQSTKSGSRVRLPRAASQPPVPSFPGSGAAGPSTRENPSTRRREFCSIDATA